MPKKLVLKSSNVAGFILEILEFRYYDNSHFFNVRIIVIRFLHYHSNTTNNLIILLLL